MSSDLRNVLLGLASAAVAALFARLFELLRRRRRRAKAARNHPIDGYYASTYTDELNGAVRTIRDEVRIRQHGLEFQGFSRNLVSGRQFNLTGRIVNDRYLAGTYGGEHRADESSGVFYMALDLLTDGYVRGLWAGYGAESGSVISGKWHWRKLARVTIAEGSQSDPLLSGASSLLNDALGSGFTRTEDLDELCESPQGIVLVATDDRGALQGVGTAMVMAEEAKQELSDDLVAAGVRRPNIVGNRVGLLKSAAVVPAARGQGMGLRLVNERLKRLKDLGCSMAVVLAWDSGDKHSSIGVLEAAGFRHLADLPEYWREPKGEETFDCIKCGRPCVCTAVAMRRSLYDFTGDGRPAEPGRFSRSRREGPHR